MKIHYFQRYHQKENVATANTMLLLSRFYQYSSDKFFQFIKDEFFSNTFEPEIQFRLQEKSGDKRSIPDATITQESFKIVIETKIKDWFYTDQLKRHLTSFTNENHRAVLALCSELMADKTIDEFIKVLDAHNQNISEEAKQKPVRPIGFNYTTFEDLANDIRKHLDDNDFQMQEVLNDYEEFLVNTNLITEKNMRVQLARKSIDFNVKENCYYDGADRGFGKHDYLGLYCDKSVRAVGKVIARITALVNEAGTMVYEVESGELTDERKAVIERAIQDAAKKGWNLRTIKHRYFFVDKFYETDFKKTSLRAPMGSRVFDLKKLLNITGELPSTEELARLLKTITWEDYLRS
ncbi:MAG: hypothetical protein K5753_02180 [Clostridia bacterium]|nr:hypothetical protein [Clostridia bacterium]